MDSRLFTRRTTKHDHTRAAGYRMRVLYLSPARESRILDACPHASRACAALCLGHSAGRMALPDSKQARVRRTRLLVQDPATFRALVERELQAAARAGCAVRLNGSSDLDWTATIARHPSVQFIDYTKNLQRMLGFIRGELPKNYYLVFSRSETNDDACARVAAAGGSIAIVAEAGAPLPPWTRGKPIVNGDAHDARWTDPPGAIVLLTPKGAARRDRSGFVIRAKGRGGAPGAP